MNSGERSLPPLSTTCSTGYRSSFFSLLKSFQVSESTILFLYISSSLNEFMWRHVLFNKNVIIYDWTGEVFGKGYLEITSEAVTKHIGSNSSGGGEVKMLNAITEPLTKLVVQVTTANTTIYVYDDHKWIQPEQTLSSIELCWLTFFGTRSTKEFWKGGPKMIPHTLIHRSSNNIVQSSSMECDTRNLVSIVAMRNAFSYQTNCNEIIDFQMDNPNRLFPVERYRSQRCGSWLDLACRLAGHALRLFGSDCQSAKLYAERYI